jgi:tRNA-2-methylthio-N6-dimethylallyladenosine synthase
MKEIQDLWDKVLKLHFWAKCSYLWYGGGLKKDFATASEMQKQQLILINY